MIRFSHVSKRSCATKAQGHGLKFCLCGALGSERLLGKIRLGMCVYCILDFRGVENLDK